MSSAEVPVLVRVTDFAELAVFRIWPPNDRMAGWTLTPGAGANPVPIRLAVWGLLPALSLTVNVPLRVPGADGRKVTLMVQLVLPARLDLQSSVSAKSPVVVMELMVREVEAGFVRVMSWELLVPTIWLPNVRLVGASWAGGAVINPKTPTPLVVPT